MTYRALDPAKILETLTQLRARIGERFPNSGLTKVCDEAVQTAALTQARVAAALTPNPWLRYGVWALIGAGAIAQIFAARLLNVRFTQIEAVSLVSGLEAAVNLLLLFGGGVWFLLTLEERLRRQRVLAALHELRALAHVIDMHQLTKDPTIVLNPHLRTQASPARAMSEFELARYLDYCAEMLALLGKLAALYSERMRDPVIIEAVNDVENLTANLGRKIWQKIMIISQLDERRAGA
ncbi:MAG: hypothetical protein ABW199_00070 [Caulobacterales bacterium]